MLVRRFDGMELILSIYDVLRSDVDQLNLLESKKIERHLNILKHVKSHLSLLSRLKMEKKNQWNDLSQVTRNLTKCSPESTSSSDSKLCPSRKSSNRSSTRRDA